MSNEKNYMSGFLILGLALFITGFLTGMLSIAVLHTPSDFTTLGIITFVFGLATGILIAIFTAKLVKQRKRRKPEQVPTQ